jgi:large subunit ribosomal protein L6
MSRIGKKPIPLPAGVTVNIDKSNVVTVKGPKGTLSRKVDADIQVELEEGQIVVSRPTEQKRHKAMHGLYRTLINNLVVGVTDGYEKRLEVVGVGYKATNTGNRLELTVGYSHPVIVMLPEEIKLATETVKGQAPAILLSGIDKELLGQVAAKIRSIRKPEPYKGKGLKYSGEVLRRKAGKTSGKGGKK